MSVSYVRTVSTYTVQCTVYMYSSKGVSRNGEPFSRLGPIQARYLYAKVFSIMFSILQRYSHLQKTVWCHKHQGVNLSCILSSIVSLTPWSLCVQPVFNLRLGQVLMIKRRLKIMPTPRGIVAAGESSSAVSLCSE